jgi:hypothetical protein
LTWIKYFDKNWILALTIGIYGRTLLLLAALRFQPATRFTPAATAPDVRMMALVSARDHVFDHLDDLFTRLKLAVVERQLGPD